MTIKVEHPKLKLGKPKADGRKNNGKHFRGNSLEAGTHPNVIVQRQNFRLGIAKPRGGPRAKKILTEATLDALDRTVIIDGQQTNLTVAELIVQQRALEALQPNDASDTALKATELLWDRSEGRAVGKTELSGPDGGPIETVETSVVLAKLFS